MAQRRGIRAPLGMLILVSVCLAPRPVPAQSENTERIYQRLLKSTVWVVVPRSKDPSTNRMLVATGSGSLVDRARRLVLTNYHVVGKDSETVLVTFPVHQNGKIAAVA